jgi:Kef-type K+ transport system membrane component KefB
VSDNPIVRDIGVIVVAAVLFVGLGRAARIPSIVAYMLAGLVLGPWLGLVQANEPLEVISEAGIALLLFLVGLELSFDKVKDVGRVALITGVVQIAVMFAVGFAVAVVLGHPRGEAAFLGAAASFSSTVLVVKLLVEMGQFQETHGRLAVGVLLVEDLVVIVVLTFVAGLAGESDQEAGVIARGLFFAFAGMTLLLATAVFASRRLLPRAFGWISRSQEAQFIWSLSWCFVLILAAEALHLSVEIGAFLAGVSLAQLPSSRELARRVHPLMSFFIAIFFVTLGIQMELGAALARWPTVLVLSALVVVVQPALIAWVLSRGGYGERTAVLTGISLGQISEFSFILGSLALAGGLLNDAVISLVGAVGLITMGVSSFTILHGDAIHSWATRSGLTRLLRAKPARETPSQGEAPQGHVIVVGMNALGLRIVRELRARGERTLAIDTDPIKLRGLQGRTLPGNVSYLSVLDEAGLARAKLLVSALQIEDINRLLAFRCSELGVPCSIHAFDQSLVAELSQLGASHVMESRRVGLDRVLDALHDAGVYGS